MNIQTVNYDYLPRLKRVKVLNNNQLFTTPAFHQDGLTLRWRQDTPGPLSYWLLFESGEHHLTLGFDGDIVNISQTPLDWRDYDGELAKIAWCSNYEPLVQLFQNYFRCDWSLTSIRPDPPEVDYDVAAQFLIEKGPQLAAQGTARFPSELLQRVPHNTKTAVLPSHVEVSLPCVIDSFFSSIRELQRLEPGCIIRLNTQHIDRVQLSHKPPLQAQVNGRRLTLTALHSLSQEESTMKETTDAAEPERSEEQEQVVSDQAPELNPVPIHDLPINLRFEAGKVTIPVNKLSQLVPGFVFELERELDQRTIQITANDALVAQGELVSVDQVLGVRVTHLCRSQ